MASELRALRDSLVDARTPPSAPVATSSNTTRWRSIAALAFVVGVGLGIVFAPARHNREREGEDPLFQPF